MRTELSTADTVYFSDSSLRRYGRIVKREEGKAFAKDA